MNTFDEDFFQSWLTEMPMGISSLSKNLFNSIVSNQKEFIQAGLEPESLGDGYYRLQGSQVAFYWHLTDSIVDIIVEVGIRPQSLVVHQIAKNPDLNTATHATDLYQKIIQSNNKSLVLMSDEYLTDDGLGIWIRLINLGHTISVYDRMHPDAGLTPLSNQRELKQFFMKGDGSYKRYQYVLSESTVKLTETKSFFNTKQLRILSGYPK